MLIRLNKKSVTVHTEDGNRWNVAPQLLTLVKRPLTLEAPGSIREQTSNQALHQNKESGLLVIFGGFSTGPL